MTGTPEPVFWPRAIRLIHATVALSVILDLFVLESGDPPHRYVGYTAAGLVIARALFGVFGRGSARFAAFPWHHRLAAATYFGIWLCVLGLGVTGFMLGLDRYFGEEWLENVHEAISNVLMALAGLHLAGVARDAFLHRRPTWMAMWDGRRR